MSLWLYWFKLYRVNCVAILKLDFFKMLFEKVKAGFCLEFSSYRTNNITSVPFFITKICTEYLYYHTFLFNPFQLRKGKKCVLRSTTQSVIWRIHWMKLLLSPLPCWGKFGLALKNAFNLMLPVTKHICLMDIIFKTQAKKLLVL